MKSLGAFEFVTLDGYYAGPQGEIDWFKSIPRDREFDAYTQRQSSGEGTLMFGRTTFEMMRSFWPTAEAIKSDPHMAGVMNARPKIVISKSLRTTDWQNSEVVRELSRGTILDLKKKSDITVLGSGSIVQQLANLGLVDEYQLVVVPMVLGAGKRLFDTVRKADLKLLESRGFDNGVVTLRYSAA